MFESLVVLHCELDSKKKVSHIFQSIEEKLFCFRPATCSRQIFIFDKLAEEEKEIFTKYCETLAAAGQPYDLYTGFDAFEFLLKWAVGLLNPRYNFNDRFVLGKCRELWTTFCDTNATHLKGRPMAKLIPQLLEDAGYVRSTIENRMEEEKISASSRIKIMTDLCHTRRERREHQKKLGALSFFDVFWNTESSSEEENDGKIGRLGKKIKRLQEVAETEDEIVTPKISNKSRLIVTQSAIASCWIKRQLEHANQPAEETTQFRFEPH